MIKRFASDLDERAVSGQAGEGRAASWFKLWLGFILALVLAGASVIALHALNVLPSLLDPFGREATTKSSPVLLQSIRDLNRYVAAEGEFQVIVDVQEGRDNIPSVLYGERTVVVGVGTVAAYVDFANLGGNDLQISADGKSISVTLPSPTLDRPALDTQRSYVLAHQDGVVNRILGALGNNPADQLTYYRQAEEQIAGAAQQSDLTTRARTNTITMLTNLFRQLGYTATVTFADPSHP